jgi:predicted ATPase/DNA-binding XRE family transcriptional regulator
MPGSNPSSLGEMLLTYRIRSGLSQEALAEASGVSARTISDLERGQRTAAHLETIRMLAAALELSESQRRHLLGAGRPNLFQASVWTDSPPQATYGTARWAASTPTPSTPLVGRSQELAQLTRMLVEHSRGIVTISGTGGVGKTRLAIEAANRLASAHADGTFFVNLATVSEAEGVPNAIAKVLGLSLQARSVGDDLKRFFANRHALLILDNFEHVIDAASFVASLSATCAQLTILVTSRTRLRLTVEREFKLAPFPLAEITDTLDRLQNNDANMFFDAQARRIDPTFSLTGENALAVTEICRRLDGLPLAIELAASRLRMMPVPNLLERLNRRLPLLSGGARDLPMRQQSMRATIGWSYDLLSVTEQRFLRWSSVFSGGLSLDSAEAIGHELDLDPFASLEALSTLVESGLAHQTRTQNGTPRIYLFETIREFGIEQLDQTGELEPACQFHAVYFLEFANRDAPAPDQLARDAWIHPLVEEHDNLIPAFDLLCTPKTAEHCLQFAAAMGPYWDYCGPYTEARPRLSRALALAPVERSMLELHARCWTSFVLAVSSDYEEALASASSSIDLAREIGSANEHAAALQALALAQECHERFEPARALMEQVMVHWESVGNSEMLASCQMYHSGLEYARGNLIEAIEEVDRARRVFAAIEASAWTACCSWYQGVFAMTAGDVLLAATRYEESLQTWLRSGTPWRWFKPLTGLADAGAAAGCFASASRLIGATEELLAVTGAELFPFDKPGYERAKDASHKALGDAVFESLRQSGRLLTPDEWLQDASEIVEAARLFAASTTT